MRKFNFIKNFSKAAALLCAAAVFFASALTLPLAAAAAAERVAITTTERVANATTERVANAYVGSRDYLDVLFNIDFQDIGGSWARDAIYEAGALGIIKGYGSAVYNGGAVLTKGQAVALAIRAAGQEGAAQQAGEALEDANRRAGLPASGAEAIWINGSLRIAVDSGLISGEDYEAAMGAAASQALSAFRRDAAAQRQELAYWLAKALNIEPVRGQESLFTYFTDWRDVDSLYVPYIEAALREKIINGAGGALSPRAPETREMAAQMIKNASDHIFPVNGFKSTDGVIERIETDIAAGPAGINAELMRSFYYIRNQQGGLDTITTQIAVSDSAGEASGARRETGLAVRSGGALYDETVLKKGDRIRYVSAVNREAGRPDEIRYVELLGSAAARSYLLAQIDGVDVENRRIAFTQIFPLEFPDTERLRRAADAPQELLRLSAEYTYSEDLSVVSEGRRIDAGGLSAGMTVIIGIENFRSLFYIETAGLGYHLGKPGIARGLVEENNPVLGYISMYGGAGDRTGIDSLGKDGGRPELLIYNYPDASALDVRKDGFSASIDDISAGDSAFVHFNAAGELVAVSAQTNYKARYGTIVSILNNAIVVQFDGDGAPQSVELNPDILVFMNNRLAGRSALAPGSSIRMLFRDLGGATELGEITVMDEGERGLAGAVYKAVLSRIDETSQKAVIYNVQKLVNGKWEWTDRKGFDAIPVNAGTRVFADRAQTTLSRANKMMRDCDVYISTKNDFGGVEVAAQINVQGADDKEQVFDGTVRGVRRPAGLFGLLNGPADIAAGDWTIVIKDGKLVGGATIAQDDLAYVVASREDASGRIRADVVEIGGRSVNTGIHIYRGRISKIVLQKEFTLESFSEFDFNGTEWRYANTPKTFALTFDTLYLTADGPTQLSMFDSRGPYNYANPPRSVYVLSDGTNALAISTAPYGGANIRGEIIELAGLSYDDDGAQTGGPDEITLARYSYYDRQRHEWINTRNDAVVTLSPDTLIVRNGAPVESSALKKSDAVRVVRAHQTDSGIGYIIIVE